MDDRGNCKAVRFETEDSKACFYIGRSPRGENPQGGETVIMQALGLGAEVGKMPGRSMLMAESEIKRPRGHSSGKVQSPKFGRTSPPYSRRPPLGSPFLRRRGLPEPPRKSGITECSAGRFAVKEMNNECAVLLRPFTRHRSFPKNRHVRDFVVFSRAIICDRCRTW